MKVKTLTLLTTTLLIMANTAFAQVRSGEIFIHKVGQTEVILLSERQGQGSSEILIDVTPQMRNECIPSGTFPNAINAFLVKTSGRNVLIDTGIQSAKLLSNLGTLGIIPEQIDAVLITHMHGDHIGGLLENDKVVCPNAKIYISQPEYDYWMNDDVMQQFPEDNRGRFLSARKVIAAYKDNLNLFQPNALEEELYALLPGISAIAAYGHTPGHTVYVVESDNEQILIWGDMVHAMAIQMPYPSVAVTFDIDPKQAVITKEKVLDYVSRNNIPVAGMHIPFSGMGVVSTSLNGYVFYPYNE